MLTKLFRDNIESRNPATRLAAIERLQEASAEHQEKLTRIASTDPDDNVRCAAIAKVTDPICLAALLGDAMQASNTQDAVASSDTVVASASARLENLLLDTSAMDATANARLAATGSREACVLIACHATDEASRNSVLIMLDDQAQVARVE